MSVAAHYYARLTTPAGVEAARFENWENLEFSHVLNGIGYYNLKFADNDDPRFDLFELDSQLEIFREVPGAGLPWYLEFEALHRTPSYVVPATGKKTFAASGFDYNHLLSRRIIGYKAGTIRADKNAIADIVMKEFVTENCGPDASTLSVVGRLSEGDIPGFSVDAPGTYGGTWAGSRAFENLLDVLIDISKFSTIDFKVVSIGDALFEFQTAHLHWGLDRTEGNLDGNAPVIFTLEHGNIQTLNFVDDRSKEANVAYVLGQGEKSLQDVTVAENVPPQGDSPLNKFEVSRPGGNLEFEYQREALGQEILAELTSKAKFEYQPLQQKSTLYGLHYKVGDNITVKFKNIGFNKKIIGVKIGVQASNEKITLTFGDL